MDGTGSIGGARICRVAKATQTRRGQERCGAEGIGSLGKLRFGSGGSARQSRKVMDRYYVAGFFN